jgi:hypothetical protein
MKFLVTLWFLTGTLLIPVQEGQQVDLQLQDLLTDKEFRDYRRRPRYRNRIDLFKKIFDRNFTLLARHVKRNELGESSDLLLQIQALCRYVEQESNQVEEPKDLRSKQVKQLEIRLRRLIESIKDLQAAAPYEYLDQFEVTVQTVAKLRKLLLTHLFGEGVTVRSPPGRSEPGGSMWNFGALSFATAGMLSAPPANSMQTKDRFTDQEYTRIQLAQELTKRVEVFLEIAESRLEEIGRRMDKLEWVEEEENPLEFHTYWDMVHAYRQAIDGIMINIDEKAIYKTASEKDIEKSLKELNKGIGEFIPQLEPLKELAIELQDQALYEELLEAEEISITAQKGSLYGLGAPPE